MEVRVGERPFFLLLCSFFGHCKGPTYIIVVFNVAIPALALQTPRVLSVVSPSQRAFNAGRRGQARITTDVHRARQAKRSRIPCTADSRPEVAVGGLNASALDAGSPDRSMARTG